MVVWIAVFALLANCMWQCLLKNIGNYLYILYLFYVYVVWIWRFTNENSFHEVICEVIKYWWTDRNTKAYANNIHVHVFTLINQIY